jgi:hypothetical protein
MTFKEIYKMTVRKAGARENNSYGNDIIKNAINYAYVLLATQVDKKVTSKDVAYAKVITVPSDFASLVALLDGSIELSELDYDLKGNAIVMHIDEDDVTSPMKLHYIQSPAKLVADSDTVSINDVCCSAISTYGAYAYALSSGELQKATLLLGEFNNFLKTYGISVEVDKNESQRTV